MSRAIFSSSIPTEKEYFEEYEKYNTPSCWFILIFILRGLVPLCLALQTGIFEFAGSIGLFMDVFFVPTNITDDFILNPSCATNDTESGTENLCFPSCNQKNVVLKMSLIKSIASSLGPLFGGVLSDLYGRRPISLCCSIIWFLSSIIISTVKHKVLMEFVYAITTASANIVNVVTFVTFAEITSRRNRLLVIYTITPFILGHFILNFLPKTFTLWKYFTACIVAANILVVFATWYIPESPRWLFNKNKEQKAYKQLNDISGLIYTVETQNENEHSNSSKKIKILAKMFAFLFKRKLKYFLVLFISMIVSSFLYNCSKMRTLSADFGILAIFAEIMGFLFLLPVYIFAGKRLGLLFIYILLIVQSICALAISEADEIYLLGFSILFGITALCLNWLYYLETFPTFLRGTVMGFSFAIFGLTTFVGTFIAENKDKVLNSIYYYAMLLCGSILGLLVFLLPEAVYQELPNYKIDFQN